MPWYTIRSHKRHFYNPELPWSNTAEVSANQQVVPEQAQGGMEAWRLFERTLTFELIEFHDATFSTWRMEDPEETPPDELFQYQGTVDTGNRPNPAAPAPLDDTLFLNRLPVTGQKGKLFLRGCISEDQLTVTARKRVLTSNAQAVFESLVASAFEQLQMNLGAFGLTLGMVSFPRIGWQQLPTAPGAKPKYGPVYGTDPYERAIIGMRVKGTTPLQLRQH